MNRLSRFVTGGLVLLLACPAWADAAGDYQALFGQEEKGVAAKGAKAAPEFAAKLLNAARTVGGQTDLQALLCEKACEFGMKAAPGYATAVDAMKLLVDSAGEDRKAAAQDKLLAALQLRYAKTAGEARKRAGEELVDLLVTSGDARAEAKQSAEAIALYRRALALATAGQAARTKEITDKIRDLCGAQETEKKLADLKAKLEKDPADMAARTALMLLYLGELDDPAEAAKLLTADVDEGLRTYVPLAAKKVEDLEEGACIQLAEWYASLAEKASPVGKGVFLGRAKACCQQYLALHTAQDAALLKAKMLLARADKALEKAQSPPAKVRTLTLDLGNKVTMKLAFIPAGKFMMGSPETEAGRGSDEGPQYLVTISKPFYMGVYEVTQAQYEAVMGKNPSKFKAPDCPLETVNWDEAVEFCKKLSQKTKKAVRLPSEAEWEYACRAGTRAAFWFGDDPGKLGDYAWLPQNSDGKTHPVGQKKPNPWGLYDMHGNVWEWCSDWRAESYAKAKAVDPHGPESGTARVLRGGGWSAELKYYGSARRHADQPGYRYDNRGLRVVAAGAD